jgi:hypothetical protein
LSEILKTLWGKLYAWAIPSALTLGVYCLFVYPNTSIGHEWLKQASDNEKATIFVAVTATVAFCLNAFSTPLYRLLEGYLWPPWLQNYGTELQLARKRRLQKPITDTGWHRGLVLEKLALYPKRDDQVAPTRFGNAIRSFETYGKTRFNLDSQSLWYELSAVAPKYIQTEIKDAQSVIDFFVALTYLSAVLGLATFVIAACEAFKLAIVTISILSLLMTVFCHRLAVIATVQWGYTVQALVNIGRVKLADSLGLQLPDRLEDEKVMWGLVTWYGFFCDEADGAQLNQFRKKRDTGAQPASDSHPAGNAEREKVDDTLKDVDDTLEEDDESSGAS